MVTVAPARSVPTMVIGVPPTTGPTAGVMETAVAAAGQRSGSACDGGAAGGSGHFDGDVAGGMRRCGHGAQESEETLEDDGCGRASEGDRGRTSEVGADEHDGVAAGGRPEAGDHGDQRRLRLLDPAPAVGLRVATLVHELLGLAFCEVVAVLFWPFGSLPDSAFVLGMPAMFAAGPVAELYRTGPPRRRAAPAAFLTALTVARLSGTAADWAFPPLADQEVGHFASLFVGAPTGVGLTGCPTR